MLTQDIEPKFFTIADLMARWSVSKWTIYRLAQDGRIKKTRIRGAVRFSLATITAYEKNVG